MDLFFLGLPSVVEREPSNETPDLIRNDWKINKHCQQLVGGAQADSQRINGHYTHRFSHTLLTAASAQINEQKDQEYGGEDEWKDSPCSSEFHDLMVEHNVILTRFPTR